MLTMAPQLHAQAISGLVRLAPSGAPAAQTLVLAVTDGARIVAGGRTDASGVFALHLGQPGMYHLLFVRARSEAVTTPDFYLDSPATVERVFDIAGDSAIHDSLYLAADVTRPATPGAGVPYPRYPDQAALMAVRGRVRMVFVVDTSGRIDQPTASTIGTTDKQFAKVVRHTLRGFRYVPARIRERPVPQLVEQLYDFGCQGDPADVPLGTIVIRSMAPTCQPAP
jgi:TonB family protein